MGYIRASWTGDNRQSVCCRPSLSADLVREVLLLSPLKHSESISDNPRVRAIVNNTLRGKNIIVRIPRIKKSAIIVGEHDIAVLEIYSKMKREFSNCR